MPYGEVRLVVCVYVWTAQSDAGEKAEMVRETADDCLEESMMCVFMGKEQQRLLFPHCAQL